MAIVMQYQIYLDGLFGDKAYCGEALAQQAEAMILCITLWYIYKRYRKSRQQNEITTVVEVMVGISGNGDSDGDRKNR